MVYYHYILIVIDSEADAGSNTESDTEFESNTESPPSAESPPAELPSSAESPPAEYSDWDGFSDSNISLDSASDAFTDNHTDSEPEGTIEVDTSWIYTTVEEQEDDIARRRYLRRRNRHIRERDRRRLARELKEVAEDYFEMWIEQDQDQVQDQDTRPQKRQYSSEPVDSDRRYPVRKRQLTAKAAALIIE